MSKKFNDAKTGLSSAYAIYLRSGGKLKTVKEELTKENGYQLNKQTTKINYFPIIGPGLGSWQIDLMFVSPPYRGTGIILCCVNVNNRYAYCYAMKSKKQTTEYLEKFLEDAKKERRPVKFIQSDKGSEFLNSKVNKLFNTYNIKHETVNVGDHAGQAIVERFNGTLRRLIILYISSNNNNNWVDVLHDLVENYNTRFHSSLKTSPINADETLAAAQKYDKYLLAKRDFDKIKINDKVRVLKEKDVFDKGKKQWSTTVYSVEGKQNSLIKLDNGLYYKHYQLQIVNGDNTDDEFEKHIVKQKKQMKIVRALNKEGIISDGSTVIFKKGYSLRSKDSIKNN
jgi:hypothetical protein